MTARPRVYLSGTLQARLQRPLEDRGLLPIVMGNGVGRQVDSLRDPSCRAMVVDVPNLLDRPGVRKEFLDSLNNAAGNALDNGVRIIYAVQGSATRDVAYAAQEVNAKFAITSNIDTLKFRPHVVHWEAVNGAEKTIADLCFSHEAGRGAGSVKISYHSGTKLDPQRELLLRRSFNDAEEVVVRALNNRGVFHVQLRKQGAALSLAYIFKVGYPRPIDEERGALEICAEITPYPYLPPLSAQRCVSGNNVAALVSHFVDRAMEFGQYIVTHSPAVAIASLFDGPLRCWHSFASRSPIDIPAYVFEKGIVPSEPERYASAFKSVSAGAIVRTPQQLLAALAKVGRIEVMTCMSHGDLHAGNLFVRDNTSEVVLIDFRRADPQAPASRDAAELDVSLAFGTNKRDWDDREIAALYSGELLKPGIVNRHASPCVIAIEQIRRQIAPIVQETEYRIMVAMHCLWYAKKGNALAYSVADKLIP